jgi:hypothetical protein
MRLIRRNPLPPHLKQTLSLTFESTFRYSAWGTRKLHPILNLAPLTSIFMSVFTPLNHVGMLSH